MRIFLLAGSAMALSACSWSDFAGPEYGPTSGTGYYSSGASSSTSSCGHAGHTAYQPVAQQQTVEVRCLPGTGQKASYEVGQSGHQGHTSYQQHGHQQHVQQPVQYQTQASTASSYSYGVPHSQPTYTTGHYGSHAQTGHYGKTHHDGLRGLHAPKRGGFYVQGYGGLNMQGESSNDGVSGAFTTGDIGDGTTIAVADGTAYGWETEFDMGSVFGAEAGYRSHKGWRVGLEGTRSTSDVEGHEDVTLDAGDIGALDAASIAQSATPLGVTVADFVADGQGDIEQKGVFLNGYYDFDTGSRFTPYVGAGVGMVDVDVNYAPSGTPVISSSDTVFGYQGRVGASYNVTGPVDVFTEYTYRATKDIEADNLLFPGTLDVENKQSLVTVGARYNF